MEPRLHRYGGEPAVTGQHQREGSLNHGRCWGKPVCQKVAR